MNYAVYLLAFALFAQSENPSIPKDQVDRLAATNWSLAGGRPRVARRLAAMEATECTMQVAASLKERLNWKGIPRTDYAGGHYDLLSQEARLLGILDDKNWRHDERFYHLKEICCQDPTLGTFLVFQAFIREEKDHGLEKATHWWQSGKIEAIDEEDEYLKTVWQKERKFDRFVRGVVPKGANQKELRNEKVNRAVSVRSGDIHDRAAGHGGLPGHSRASKAGPGHSSGSSSRPR
jgi:hypothetical protein